VRFTGQFSDKDGGEDCRFDCLHAGEERQHGQGRGKDQQLTGPDRPSKPAVGNGSDGNGHAGKQENPGEPAIEAASSGEVIQGKCGGQIHSRRKEDQ